MSGTGKFGLAIACDFPEIGTRGMTSFLYP